MNPVLLICSVLGALGISLIAGDQGLKWWKKRKEAKRSAPAAQKTPIEFSADQPPSPETIEFHTAMKVACPGSDPDFRELAILSGWSLYRASREWSIAVQERQAPQ